MNEETVITADDVGTLTVGEESLTTETEVVENEAGEVMFDPNAEVSDEQATANLEVSTDDEPVKSTISESTPPNPTPSRAVGQPDHRTSRQKRKDRQRGR